MGQCCLGHHAFLNADAQFILVLLFKAVDIFPRFLIDDLPFNFVLLTEFFLLLLEDEALLLLILDFLRVLNLSVFEFAVLEQFQFSNFALKLFQLLSLFRFQIKIAVDISLLLLFEFIALDLKLLQVQHSDMVQFSIGHGCIAHVLYVHLSLLLFVVLRILSQYCLLVPDFLLLCMQVMARLLFIVFLFQLQIVFQSLYVSLAPVSLLFFDENFIVKQNLGSVITLALLLAEREYSDYATSAGGKK